MCRAGAFLAVIFLCAASNARAEDGAALYQAQCAKCHGADGNADTPVAKAMKVPALVGKRHSVDPVIASLRMNPKHAGVSPKVSNEQLAELATFLGTLGGN